MVMMPLLLLLGTTLLATGAAAESSCSSSELEDDGCCPGYTPSNDVPPCPAGYSASTSTSINNWVEVYSCTCTPSMSVSFDWSEASASTTMPIGLVSVALGLMIALFGYKLWKYTIFILGFLFGAAVGVGAAAASGTTTIAGLIVPGFVGGVFGGLLFLGCYMMVIFCTGCAFGMTAFYATVIALVVSSSSPTSVLEHTNADTLQTRARSMCSISCLEFSAAWFSSDSRRSASCSEPVTLARACSGLVVSRALPSRRLHPRRLPWSSSPGLALFACSGSRPPRASRSTRKLVR
jgi:hypothetical protein